MMVGGLYHQFGQVIDETNNEINRIEINRAKALSDKIILHIRNKITGDFSLLLQDKELREDISSFLSLNVTDEFKYIYVIYKDKKGAYRYLLDGSYGVDRGEFGQKFFPLLTNIWKTSLKTGHSMCGFQKKADGLWITYLHPIIIGKKVRAVLALDISTKEYQNLNKFLIPLYNFLKVFLSVLIIIVLVVMAQMYMFYKERKKSIIDPLTKLYNRNFLKEIWHKVNLKKISIMMLDIDYFKLVNDQYGHDVGDIVLSSVARKLMGETRLEDKVIRYGGEEFLIFLRWSKSDEEVMRIADRIRVSIASEKIRISESLSINVTASIGVSVNPSKNKTLNEAIKVADRMLYIAKNKGRNRVVYANLHDSK